MLAATILGSSIAFINGSVVNIALPAIRSDLAASVAAIQWVINAYTLCLAALILVGGAMGDHFGRRRLFTAGVGVFALASLWCLLAPDIAHLMAARAFQGVGAAMLIPNSLAIIGATFDENERGKAIGTWAGFAALAATAGPLLGGWLVDNSSWRAIFLIGPALAIPTIWLALARVRESRDPGASAGLDLRGALFAFLGLGGVVVGLIALPRLGWRDAMVLAPLAFGLALLLAFLREEWRSPAPMMPLGLFRARAFSGVNVLTLLLYAALGGALFLIPFELIYVRGYSATLTGAVFLPFTIILGVLSRWIGGLQDRIGARILLIAGPVIVAIGYGLLAVPLPGDPSIVGLLLPMTMLGLGMALSVAPLTTVVINAVPRDRAGIASGINNAVAQTASLMAVAIFGAVALLSFNHALEALAATLDASPAVKAAILAARGNFAIEPLIAIVDPAQRAIAETGIKASLAHGIRQTMLIAALLALAGALVSAMTIGPAARRTVSAVQGSRAGEAGKP